MSLLQGASGKTRGHRHMLESGKSQLGTQTHLFIYLFNFYASEGGQTLEWCLEWLCNLPPWRDSKCSRMGSE